MKRVRYGGTTRTMILIDPPPNDDEMEEISNLKNVVETMQGGTFDAYVIVESDETYTIGSVCGATILRIREILGEFE